MKFIISSTTLEKHLSVLSGVIATNPHIPILENFLFDIKGGVLTVKASDMQITMTTHLEIDASEEGSLAVPARQLLDTLKSLPDQPLSIKVDVEEQMIEITSHNGRYKLAGEPALDFPRAPEPDGDTMINMAAEILSEGIATTLFAVGNDDLRPAMMGMYTKIDNSGITFVSTEGNRLVKYQRNEVSAEQEQSLIIPRKALTLLKSSLPNDGEIQAQFNDKQAFFTYGDTRLSCRLIDEAYPDYEKAIPLDNDKILEIGRNELLSSLKRLAIYVNRSVLQVRFSLRANQLKITAEDRDFSNEAHETLPCLFENEDMDVAFNVKLLIELLSNLNAKDLRFAFSHPSRAVIVTPTEKAEQEDVLMLIMPLQLNEEVDY